MCEKEYLDLLITICSHAPLQIYGSKEYYIDEQYYSSLFFAGSCGKISIDAEYRSSMPYYSIGDYFNRLQPPILAYGIFDKVLFYMDGACIGVWERHKK